jgi:hypothetical protein
MQGTDGIWANADGRTSTQIDTNLVGFTSAPGCNNFTAVAIRADALAAKAESTSRPTLCFGLRMLSIHRAGDFRSQIRVLGTLESVTLQK